MSVIFQFTVVFVFVDGQMSFFFHSVEASLSWLLNPFDTTLVIYKGSLILFSAFIIICNSGIVPLKLLFLNMIGYSK